MRPTVAGEQASDREAHIHLSIPRSYFVQVSLIMVIATTCRSRYSSLLDACSTCPSFVVFSFASTAVARAEPVSLTWRPTIGSNLMLLLRSDQIFPSSPASENVPASSPFCKHPVTVSLWPIRFPFTTGLPWATD